MTAIPEDDLPPNAIAVIGMSCRVPGANSPEELWQLLCEGKESIVWLDRDQLLASGESPSLVDSPNYVPCNRIIEGAEQFDAAFFQFTPREAELLDPQQRLFLECAHQALESAGYGARVHRDAVGVYAGSTVSSYFLHNLWPNHALAETHGLFQLFSYTDKDFLATRTSYKLDLRGPSITVQTACSTSLVAVHLACQSLLEGECNMALAGGSSIRMPQHRGYSYQKDMIFSPDGRCRPFDAQSAGTVAGDGVAVVLLKRLEHALADRDTILAVIRGSAINNDGSGKVGYTAPSVEGQARVIREALTVAGVDADSISHIETHGTATPLGDPIEIAALSRVFRESTSEKGICTLGALKANLGHMDVSAGVGSLIKAVLMLQHRQIPPVAGFESPNPRLQLGDSPFVINTKLQDWSAGTAPRRAGVSSFGIGGTNAHVILEEAPAVESPADRLSWQLLTLSAKTQAALQSACGALAEGLESQPTLRLSDVAYTLQVGREPYALRKTVVCQTLQEGATALRKASREEIAPARMQQGSDSSIVPLTFLFPGGGAQYGRMARDLYDSQRYFRKEVDLCADHIARKLVPGFDLRTLLVGHGNQTEVEQKLRRPQAGLLCLFVVEYALAKLLLSWGLQPKALLGHSLGEYAAACISGVMDLTDALALVAHRGALFESLPAGGAMLTVPIGEKELRPLLGDRLAIAAINLPSVCTVSGPSEQLEQLSARLSAQGHACRLLHIDVAAHSPAVDVILDSFRLLLRRMRLHPPQIPILSNLSGTWLTAEQATDPEYWVQHLRQTVRFSDSLQTLLSDRALTVLEVGPGTTLAGLCKLHPAYQGQTVLPTMRHPQDPQPSTSLILGTMGTLWAEGVAIDWSAFHDAEECRRVVLPTYPFERQRYYIEPERNGSVAMQVQTSAAAMRLPLADWLSVPIWKQSTFGPSNTEPTASSCWLLLMDSFGVCEELVQHLLSQGQRVVRVHAGVQFQRRQAADFSVHPSAKEDYAALLAALAQESFRPELIVHGFLIGDSSAEDSATEGSADTAVSLGLLSLVALTQALDAARGMAGVRFAVLSTGLCSVLGTEQLSPEKATYLGWLKTIPHEFPETRACGIDLVQTSGRASLGRAQCVQLMSEIQSGTAELIAYRGNKRWVQVFEPLKLTEARARQPTGLLRQGGVYLITGGLGGIGLSLAVCLAEQTAAKLVLFSRSPLPHRSEWESLLASSQTPPRLQRCLSQLLHLEQLGTPLLILNADVSSRTELQTALQTAKDRFGTIHGVIHAAGLPGGGSMLRQTPEAILQTLRPKVMGTRHLQELLSDTTLDFMFLCSALVTIPGAFGHLDYTAANAYLDAFAHAQAFSGQSRTLSVNWSRWQHVGMALALEAQHEALSAEPLEGMSEQEGREVFLSLLRGAPVQSHQISQVAVSFQALSELLQAPATTAQPQAAAKTKPKVRATHPRPALQTAYAQPTSSSERKLAMWMAELLGIEAVGIHDNFFELGGNSLIGTQLIARARQDLGTTLALRDLFSEPTVAGLANRIDAVQVLQSLKGGPGSNARSAELGIDADMEEGVL